MNDAGDSATPTPILELSNVTFGYTATPVVENVSITIEPGEYVAIVGPNGSGKSTLLQLALGLRRPDTGTARLFGESADDFDDGERIGHVPQGSDAATGMPITVREVVEMGRFAHVGFGRLGRTDRAVVDDALATVGMTDFGDRRIGALSGGQRQRAFIARAIAGEADLLVLDEPTVGVDRASVAGFYRLLESLNDEGITVVLVEHDIATVTDHVDRVVCLNRRVTFDGPTGAFVESDVLERAFGVVPAQTGEPS